MVHIFINKLSLYILFFLLNVLFFLCNAAKANNAAYITLSSQIARKTQLEVIANNVANTNTIGFEQDEVLFKNIDLKQNSKRSHSFSWAETTYRNGDLGGITVTNRPTDVAIGGKGYFKILTPSGDRYTLDGSMLINNQGIMVNSSGYPYLSSENTPIEIPDEFQTINIAQNGAIFVDDEEVAVIGVFDFDSKDPIIKEGGNLYAIQGEDILLEEFTIISGALRASNVNSTLAMAKMVEMQRSYGLVTDMMKNINEIESSSIQKLTK
jgi:flagellar basal-body rod protein FlgF